MNFTIGIAVAQETFMYILSSLLLKKKLQLILESTDWQDVSNF